jgi:hypothetical protein
MTDKNNIVDDSKDFMKRIPKEIESIDLLEFGLCGLDHLSVVEEAEYLYELSVIADKITRAISHRIGPECGPDMIFRDDHIIMNEVMPASCQLDLMTCYQIKDVFKFDDDYKKNAAWSDERASQLMDYREKFEDAMQLFIFNIKGTYRWTEIESAAKEWLREYGHDALLDIIIDGHGVFWKAGAQVGHVRHERK